MSGLAPSEDETPPRATWQAERIALLEGICRAMDAAIRGGLGTRLAAEIEAEKTAGRSYTDGTPMRLSPSTLLRLYYRWHSLGKERCAFHLDYRNTARPKLDEAVILAFQAACELPQATSFSAAYRLLAERWEQVFKQPVPVSQDTLRRHFASEDEKLALKEQFQQHTNRAKKDRNFTRHGRGAPDSDPPKNGPVIASSQPQHHGEEKEKSCNCPV